MECVECVECKGSSSLADLHHLPGQCQPSSLLTHPPMAQGEHQVAVVPGGEQVKEGGGEGESK